MAPKKSEKKTIGFIGLGLIGRAFSKNLIADGHRLVGTDVRAAAMKKFRRLGGEALDTPRAVAEAADVVFISVPDSGISLRTARGKDGYLACSPDSAPEVVLDTTTADPEDSKKHANLCRRKGIPYLDACVSGNSGYAANREGLFLVGGDRKAYDKATPLLGTMLSDQIYCGPHGSGAAMKVVVNYMTSMGRCVIAETLRLGMRSGFGKVFLFDALARSRAGEWRMLRTHGGNMLRGRFRRPLSTLNVIAKDIRLGLRQARRSGAVTPVGGACAPMFREGERAGYGELDSAAVYLSYLDRENRKQGVLRARADRGKGRAPRPPRGRAESG